MIEAGLLQPIIDGLIKILDGLNQLTGNYGWAIILLAIFIKIALYYPTRQQFQAMKEMQAIQPELQKLQKLYKDNPQQLQSEQMLLFKKHKINPLGGCLPVLIQFPFLWAIYYAIKGHETIFAKSGFLWIGGPLANLYPKTFAANLSLPDIPLLLIYGYSMYLTSKVSSVDSPMMGGKNQIFMTLGMPILFTYMMWKWAFPSALVLYWLAFNLLSIIHQSFLMREPCRLQFYHTPATPPKKVNQEGGKTSASGRTDRQVYRGGKSPSPAKTGSPVRRRS